MNHNRPIYHCQCCGAVLAQEAYCLPPFCCGHDMTKAAEETLRDDFGHELDLEPEFAKPRLAPRWAAPMRGHLPVST